MTRWHSPSCQSPLVWVGGDSVPRCNACGASAHEQLQQLREHPSNPFPPLPPDEKAGQLNLHWPSSVSYTREQSAAALAEEIRDSLQISDTPSPRTTQTSLIHGRTLARDEFRLICLTAGEKDAPVDVIHLSLEAYNDDNFPDYEAVSYTWGGEDGDSTLRHPIYIGEHWDILLQTRNCCAMLRYLRPSRGIRMVWVDAICINQEDLQERGDQVAKMGQLYTGCFQVFLWLGDDIAFKKPGVHPPRLPLYELENMEEGELHLPSETERVIVNLQNLFERRYFSRVWIIQELILPPRIAIPIGDKIFWADPSTPTHFERLSSRDWLWEQTRAPWFQHATRGSLMRESLSGLLALTWKSQSSDIRDKIYGVLGLGLSSLQEESIQIRPNYGISLQHLLIGFFAHCIIRGGTPQLLLKAAGASAEAGMPSWMPPWKGDAWERLFSSNGNSEENPTWESVENWLIEVRKGMQRAREAIDKSPYSSHNRYGLVRFLPRALFKEESKFRKTIINKGPWHQEATVDADTGGMSLNLTKLVTIKNRPVRIDAAKEGWYMINHTKENSLGDYICIMSRSQLEKVVEAGDDIFLLDTIVRTPIYLVLRKTGSPGEFRLIAVCPYLVFLLPRQQKVPMPSWEPLPLGDLQESLHADLTRMRGFFDHDVSRGADDVHQGIRKRFLFPGRRGQVTFKEVLPLLLGLARDKHKPKLKSQRGFQELYPESIDARFQPRVFDGFCEVSLGAEDEEEIDNLLYSGVPRFKEMEGWTKVPAKEDAGRVVLQRHMSVIEPQLRDMVSTSGVADSLELFDKLVDRFQDEDVGERIMAGPVEEDHFRGGTHSGLDEVFKKFGLDGSTFRVRVV